MSENMGNSFDWDPLDCPWPGANPKDRLYYYHLYQEMSERRRNEIAIAVVMGGALEALYVYGHANLMAVRLFHPTFCGR